jgi:hypothetical protein
MVGREGKEGVRKEGEGGREGRNKSSRETK